MFSILDWICGCDAVGSGTGEKQEVTQAGSRCKGEHVLLFQIKYQAEKFYVSAPFVEYFA